MEGRSRRRKGRCYLSAVTEASADKRLEEPSQEDATASVAPALQRRFGVVENWKFSSSSFFCSFLFELKIICCSHMWLLKYFENSCEFCAPVIKNSIDVYRFFLTDSLEFFQKILCPNYRRGFENWFRFSGGN